MIIHKSYRFRLYPTLEQEQQFQKFSGCCRAVYNAALYQRQHWGERTRLNYVSQANELPACKRAMPWLKDAPSHTLQAALRDLDRAFRNFFEGRAAYPRPRSKRRGDSFRLPEFRKDFDLRGDHIRIAKVGLVRWVAHREIEGLPKQCTVTREGDWWFASVQCEVQISDPVCLLDSAVGIDLGVTKPVALSDGTFPDFSKVEKRHKHRLRCLHQKVCRKRKGSANRRKAIKRLSAYHAHLARRRKDSAHKTTATIVYRNSFVAMEDLNIAGLTRSCKGTVENPGRNVRAKTSLNREMRAVAPFQIRRFLEYKAAWNGVKVVTVPPRYTSQECAECGHIHADNRETQAKFVCKQCGHEDNADTNGARVVLKRALSINSTEGLSGLACQANHIGDRRQEVH